MPGSLAEASRAAATVLAAATGPANAAETRNFSETIVVTGHRGPTDAASFETRNELEATKIDRLRAVSADEIARQLPAVHVPVNSRGEAIAFVRNASERQVAIFYEGADINIPWDNRLDLSLVPAALIGSVKMAAGPLAPHYGVNALAAISLSPRDTLQAVMTLGGEGRHEAQIAVPLEHALVGGSFGGRDGESLSDDADLPFSQSGRSLRTNTDRKLASLFARIAGSLGAHELSLSAFHVWGEKGIAPEGHRASGARFWRYPDIHHTLIVGNGASRVGSSTELHSSIWFQRYGQTIDNYASAAYDRITLRQVDRDRTFGVRELLNHRRGPVTLVASANFLQSTHRQRDFTFQAVHPSSPPAPLLYRQRNWSIGVELEYVFSPALRGELGLGRDEVDYVRTGDKPPVRDARDWTGRAAMLLEAGGGWRLRTAIGHKMRAPTLRERFGESISRFLPNPALEPERIVTAEVAGEWRGERGAFRVIPFIQNLGNTIDQRNVGALRQRINLAGSRIIGLETGGEWRFGPALSVSGHGVWSRVRRKDAPAGAVNRIAEKPSLLARLRLDYAHRTGLSTAIEASHVGRAFSVDPVGVLIPLARSTSVDVRLVYPVKVGNVAGRFFVNFENLTDSVIETQLGLPAPGRSIRFGLTIS